MAVTIADITKLRKITGAGLADCKNALTEANNDFDEAVKIIREKGKAVAAKRSDRDASEGCVLVKVDGNFGAMIALKCETDFVATNADFVKLTQDILDAAVNARCKTLDEVKALEIGGRAVQDLVTDRSGITGEKMELDGYFTCEGSAICAYNHMHKNFLCTMCVLNKDGFEEAGHEVALQIAAMAPLALNAEGVPAKALEAEREIAASKAKEEGKPEAIIPRIVEGRIQKFYKEVCLLEQEYNKDPKISIAQYLKKFDKDLTVVDFKRFTLRAE